MTPLPEKLKELHLSIEGRVEATLLKQSVFQLIYQPDSQRAVGLGLPPQARVYQDGDLFAALDMNLPEGYLFERIVSRFPKFALSKMHLLALMGAGGIGRVAYSLPGDDPPTAQAAVSREDILQSSRSDALFDELVDAYLGAGTALSGVQPKVMVPLSEPVAGKAIIPLPNAIIKAEGPRYPGLCANEWLCLRAAQCAGLPVPRFELSNDARLLLIDRFDIAPSGQRLGFEDIAAVMQLRVRDRLSARKYLGSYEDVAHALQLVCTDKPAALAQFFDYLVLSVLVRNGDAHLKNFGVLYNETDASAMPTVWLSPLYDQVTTTLYTFERPGGIETIDHTMALKLRRGQRSGDQSGTRSYPLRKQLEQFGRDVCGVQKPGAVIERISDGMSAALRHAQSQANIPRPLRISLQQIWDNARLGF
jgi:serine/threonine-protein kinase HipA